MDCPRRRFAAAGLPDDPLVEIFSRVPFRSLCRFKCVSKAWRDLIADPLHRRKLPQTLEGFFCGHERWRWRDAIPGGDGVGGVPSDGDDVSDGYSRDDGGGDVSDGYGSDDDGGGGWSLSLDYSFVDLMGRSVPLVDPSFSFLTEEVPDIEHMRILQCCNGLLLLRHGTSLRAGTLGYVVCNPVAEEWVALPSSRCFYSGDLEDDDSELGEVTFLFFDPAVSTNFKLLHFVLPLSTEKEAALRTYSSETGVWTNKSCEQSRLEEGDESLQLSSFGSIWRSLGSAFLNGMLHFVIDHIQKEQQLIVAVDCEGRARRVISWPRSHGCSWSDPAFVGQSQGHLYCISDDRVGNSAQMTIWGLEDYDKEEWVMKHRVSSFQLFGRIRWTVHFNYAVVAIHPDRNLIFISHQGLKLISYNMDSKEVHALSTLRDGYDHNITPYVPNFSESPVVSNKH